MPRPTTPVPNSPKWFPREFSKLRNSRDKGSPLTHWKNQEEYAIQINSLTEFCKVIWKEISKIKPKGSSIVQSPFRIYNVPSILQQNADIGQYWRTFSIRNGCVLTDIVSTGSFVFGTDNAILVDQQTYGNFPNSPQYQVPDGVIQYWFWIEKKNDGSSYGPGTGSYVLRYGSDPTLISVGNPIPWSSFPSASTTHFPIGYVDTQSSSSIQQAFVRQFLRTDVLNSGGSSNTNDLPFWDYSSSYSPNQRVLITSSITQYIGGSSSFWVYPGIAHSEKPIESLTSGSRSGSVQVPYYPMDNNSYWKIESMGIQQLQVCGKTAYVQFQYKEPAGSPQIVIF